MIKRFIIAAIIIAVFLGGAGYFHFVLKPEMIRGFIAKAAPPPATVSAAPAKVNTWVQRLTSIGTLTAIQSIEVSSQVAGIVDEILFEGGVAVHAGAPLVRLDAEVEKADLASNKATLKQAELELARQQDLVRRGSTPQSRLDEAQAQRDTAAAAVQRTEAVIDQKSIEAPFSGRLGIRQVDLGQYVSAGMALVTLQSLDPIYVDFAMPEQYAGLLGTHQKVEVTFDAFPGEVFTGEVVTLDARVNKDTRSLLVRGRLPNRNARLLPGMFANVTVMAGEPRAVVTVPRTAITYSLYGDSVFVVKSSEKKDEKDEKKEEKKDGAQVSGEVSNEATGALAAESAQPALTVERRFVRVGEVRGHLVAITEGVSPGETVVTSGQNKLQSGGAVTIDNSASLQPVAQRPRQ